MEYEKLKQWMDLTNQYQTKSFWNDVFESKQIHATEELAANFFSNQDIFPRCDVFEENECLIVEAELPGVEINEIKVFLKQDELILKGECKTIKPSIKYYLKERPNRTFEKKITIPVQINRQEIQTHFKNGILSIILPFNQTDHENIPITLNHEESSSS
ncbi:Hsp20/alpha crystallin family protein [Cytobacillus depressus]|uniref:Hsp20/alpha crystallin family protein n=1 Tax=Cytobacillus depressus TaxID=1602942 RepID=A0A6L3V8Z6_9BACI|nr:Hsp20/alpha crystallin family protein [Cytobacillus depressus]KAB2338156.1 Hsp20/alpha crystallin family protein [Cytobacillus depressus]